MFEQQIVNGRYRIIAELAAGGMGVTYRAWDKISARPVVVKVPNRSCMNDPVLVKRFDREIELLLNCSHPSTVPILDRGHFQHVPYVVMRFLPGGSLADRQGLNTLNESRPSSPSMLHCWLPKIALHLIFYTKIMSYIVM